jgi:hypothetical protein
LPERDPAETDAPPGTRHAALTFAGRFPPSFPLLAIDWVKKDQNLRLPGVEIQALYANSWLKSAAISQMRASISISTRSRSPDPHHQ